MGVSGSGKSTLGAALANQLSCAFIEGDDLHSASARTKMASGIPLTDEDRWPWLTNIGAAVNRDHASAENLVVSCSALKQSYRNFLREHIGGRTSFVFLDISTALARQRLTQRKGHFMPAELLQSQFSTLEPPKGEANTIVLNMDDNQSLDIDQLARNLMTSWKSGDLFQ